MEGDTGSLHSSNDPWSHQKLEQWHQHEGSAEWAGKWLLPKNVWRLAGLHPCLSFVLQGNGSHPGTSYSEQWDTSSWSLFLWPWLSRRCGGPWQLQVEPKTILGPFWTISFLLGPSHLMGQNQAARFGSPSLARRHQQSQCSWQLCWIGQRICLSGEYYELGWYKHS